MDGEFLSFLQPPEASWHTLHTRGRSARKAIAMWILRRSRSQRGRLRYAARSMQQVPQLGPFRGHLPMAEPTGMVIPFPWGSPTRIVHRNPGRGTYGGLVWFWRRR